MVIDIRQHIITLAAVFLALGMGILIGMALVEDRTLVKQQRLMIDKLEADFAELSRDRDALRAVRDRMATELTLSRKFDEMAFTALARGRLVGKNMAVIVTGNALGEKELKPIMDAITYAGGRVSSVTRVLRAFVLAKDDNAEELLTMVGAKGESTERFGELLASDLIAGIRGAGGLALIPLLQNKGFIEFQGDYGSPVDSILVICGCKDQSGFSFKEVDQPIIQGIRAQEVRAIAVEPADVAVSHIKHYVSRGLTTVDNVNTPLGRLSLISALAGEDGNFGFREGAKKGVPDVFSKLVPR